jgi:hypothetical protein
MSPDQLLIPAMLIFGTLIVGLILTVLEFKKINKDGDK